ncbi:MAG TPA: ribonuclease J, partial [Mycobacterium sp.]
NAALAVSTGVPEENVVLAENGVSVDLVGGKARIAGAVPTGTMFVDGLITGDVGEVTLGERLTLASGFISITVVVRRGTGKPVAPPQLHSRGFSEDPKALESLAADKVTDPARIAQSVRRAVGKWVGEVYRRQPMIVPTVLEID